MVCSNVEGPDFICVGMPKAGTGWLFDQLQYHPDFWMPPVKGLHYLDREVTPMKNSIRRLEKLQRKPKAKSALRRACDERDLAFLRDAVALSECPRNVVRYSALFRHKGDLLSGDITAPYAGLEEDVIGEVGSTLPDVKVVLLVRDPVARAWSNVSMAYRDGRFDTALLDDLAAFEEFFVNAPMYKFSFATRTAARWAKAAPRVQFRYFLFDEIEGRPEQARADILRYLGADPEKASGQLPAGHNQKAQAKKLQITEVVRRYLVDQFADELRECAKLFGGHARQWPARYGL